MLPGPTSISTNLIRQPAKNIETKPRHFPTISLSQTNNFLYHFQTSPTSPQPKENMSANVILETTVKSNNRINMSLKETPPNHEFVRKKCIDPLLISRQTLTSNQLLIPKPIVSLTFAISFHHSDPFLSLFINLPPSSSYLATNILFHNSSISINTIFLTMQY